MKLMCLVRWVRPAVGQAASHLQLNEGYKMHTLLHVLADQLADRRRGNVEGIFGCFGASRSCG